MSEVFSFRLSKANPREAWAIEIIKKKTTEGISLRQVITEGLLALTSNSSMQEMHDSIGIQSTLDAILQIIKNGNQSQPIIFDKDNNQIDSNLLSDKFSELLRKDVKKGIYATNQ